MGTLLVSLLPWAAASAKNNTLVMVLPRDLEQKFLPADRILRSHLADLALRLHLERVDHLPVRPPDQLALVEELAAREGAFAVFWAQLSGTDRLFITIAEPGGARMLVRELRFKDEGLEDQLETMALVVRSAAKAILAGAHIGIAAGAAGSEPTTPPAVSPPATLATKPRQARPSATPSPTSALPPSEHERRWLEISVSYALMAFSHEAVLRHGARLALETEPWPYLHFFTAFRLLTTTHVQDEHAEMLLSQYPLELGAFARLRYHEWSFSAGVALLVERQTWSLLPRQINVKAVSPDARWLWGAVPLVAVSRRISPGAALFFALAADVPFNHKTFVISDDERTIPILSPWAVRPWLLLGATFHLL